MALITRDEAHVADLWQLKTKAHPCHAAVDIQAGQPLYLDANGNVNLADANGTAPANEYIGIAKQTVAKGQPVDAAEEGDFVGFDLSGLAYGAPVYVSDTAGELADAPGTKTLLVGYVYPAPDPDHTKILHLTKV